MASSVLIVGSLGLSSFVNRSASSTGGFVGTTNAGRQALNQTSSSSPMNGLWPRLLQEEISPLGEVFGWIMASIYMGGRLPQIWLNVIFSLSNVSISLFHFISHNLNYTLHLLEQRSDSLMYCHVTWTHATWLYQQRR